MARQNRKPNGENRSELMAIRVSETEKAILKELAAAAGVSVGGYLVGLALGDKLGRKLYEKPDPNQMRIDV